jgi:alkylation response protein AidB-like acyl-CoA dehydrogenase
VIQKLRILSHLGADSYWDRTGKFPMETVRQMGELGILGMQVAEEHGGAALDTLAVAVVVEEVARYDGSLALTVASHNGLGTSHLRVFGPDHLKKKYLPKLATGEYLGAWGLTEPGSGSDAAGMKTTPLATAGDPVRRVASCASTRFFQFTRPVLASIEYTHPI